MQELAPWLAIAVAAASLVYAIVSNNSKASSANLTKELDAMRTQIAGCVGRVDIVEDRASRIEQELKHIPEKDDMHKLAIEVTECRYDIRALAQSVSEMRKSVDELRGTIEENGEQHRHR